MIGAALAAGRYRPAAVRAIVGVPPFDKGSKIRLKLRDVSQAVGACACSSGAAGEAATIIGNELLAGRGTINPLKLSTLVAVAILVGTEVVGASWAAGWALGGILQLPPLISRSLEVVFGLSGFALLFLFMRVALRHEPIRD